MDDKQRYQVSESELLKLFYNILTDFFLKQL